MWVGSIRKYNKYKQETVAFLPQTITFTLKGKEEEEEEKKHPILTKNRIEEPKNSQHHQKGKQENTFNIHRSRTSSSPTGAAGAGILLWYYILLTEVTLISKDC